MSFVTTDYHAIRRLASPSSFGSTSVNDGPTRFIYRLYNLTVTALFLVSLAYLLIFHTPASETKQSIKSKSAHEQFPDDIQLPSQFPPPRSAIQFRPRGATRVTSHQKSFDSTVRHGFFNYTQARLAAPACTLDEDGTGLHCAAILHVESGPFGKVVYAGFMMYTNNTDKIFVDVDTAHRIRSLTHSQAHDYAARLVTFFATVHDASFTCGVRTASVEASIFRAAPVVSLCRHTADPHCYDDYVVATC